jgi:RHS repeat-associated protein
MTHFATCSLSLAFGEHYKFTGKERDSESGLDMFGARYYGSSLGRFMTPDWSDEPDPVPHANIHDPQTLNLYGYVQNNPLSRRDADGHVTCDPDTATWGPNGVTVTAGACHLDALDYLRLAYYTSQAINQFQQEQAARNREWLLNHVGSNSLIALLAATMKDCGCGDKDDKESSSSKKQSDPPKATSPNQMQKQVEAGQAPKSVDRVDSPRFPYEKPHIEFEDGNALNNDGTWKHGGRELTNAEKDWVTSNGWSLPK